MIVAYTALLYGKDYLGSAIRSVIDHVDQYHVLYSNVGSHGHQASRPCPETRDELYSIAEVAAGAKLQWHDGRWAHEGYQRDSIHQYAPDADVIIVLDADEIWPEEIIKGAYLAPEFGIRAWRVPIIHYWRSFYRCILHDPAYPTRIICPKISSGEGTLQAGRNGNKFINHMGYAQRSEIVEFKQETHGHKGEWRRDVDWFRDVFMANRQEDCHPVGSDYWNPEPVNPWDYLPEYMKSHPYAQLEVIP